MDSLDHLGMVRMTMLVMTVMPTFMVMVRGTPFGEVASLLNDLDEKNMEIHLGKPSDVLVTDGGRIRAWEKLSIQDLSVGFLELQPDGLVLPQYTDANSIAFVTKGQAVMGAVIPEHLSIHIKLESSIRFGAWHVYVRRVKKGDIIVIPKGVAFWWYNDGDEQHHVLCAGDTTLGVNPRHGVQHFGLVGGYNKLSFDAPHGGLAEAQKYRFGSFLHNFDRDALASAWGVDKSFLESLLQRQGEVGVVRVRHRVRFCEGGPLQLLLDGSSSSCHTPPIELTCSIRSKKFDRFVEDGGWFHLVGKEEFPALSHVGFSVAQVSLEGNAMWAPSFSHNAHEILYVLRGSGCFQVVTSDGQNLVNQQVEEGELLLIPQFYPSLIVANGEGIEWISFLTSDEASYTFLAGRNSVYSGMPTQVLAAAFDVKEDMLNKLGRDEEVIFPSFIP